MTDTRVFDGCPILTGPTASGKTALALEWAAANDAEVVCMDSMTLYRGMDIGTAKPTPAERAEVPHHLLDVLEPWESGTVADWLARAAVAVGEIRGRGKIPLLVGGTPLYLKALLSGLFDGPPADRELRARLEAEAAESGVAALHARLAARDPASAARLHVNDLRRVVRALEVWELTGRPLSDWQREWAAPARSPAGRVAVLDWPRAVLHERINARVWGMIEQGWLDETRRLLESPRPLSREAARAVGYAELAAHLRGELSLSAAVGRIQARTRQFAKHQLTWFRGMPECRFHASPLTEADRLAMITSWTAGGSAAAAGSGAP